MEKRYTTEAEIVALIDGYHADISGLRIDIAGADTKIYHLRQEKGSGVVERVRRMAELEDFIRKMFQRIAYRERRLAQLKDKLAEFRTVQIIPDDKGVEAL